MFAIGRAVPVSGELTRDFLQQLGLTGLEVTDRRKELVCGVARMLCG